MPKLTLPLSPFLLLFALMLPVYPQAGETPVRSDTPAPDQSLPAVEVRAPRPVARLGLSTPSEDFKIGAGDVLTVTVLGLPDLSKTVEVSSSGKVTLPYLNEVQVAGLTIQQLEKKLAILFDAAIVKNPQVSVLVKEYKSQAITVIGEVNKPGIYQINSKVPLINALSQAGWLTANAGETIVIQRAAKPGAPAAQSAPGEAEGAPPIEINLKSLIAAGNESLNIPVQGNDVILISKKKEDNKFFYIIGGINKSGAYAAIPGANLVEAVALAGGLTPTAKRKQIRISRMNTQGQRIEIEANLEEILKGKKENIALQEKDVVFVPDKLLKNTRELVFNSLLPGSLIPSLIYLLR